MSKVEIMNKASRTFHKIGFKLKKHSPEILIVAGVVGTVASTVMACKATTKLSGILEDAQNDIDVIHDAIAHPEDLPEEYTVDDSKKDLAIVYVQTGLKVAKLYAPAVILGTLSLTSIVTSNNILRKRNIALATAYSGVLSDFKGYRSRVVERFGKDLDRELKYDIKAKEIESTVIDEKTGKEKTVKETVSVVDPNTIHDTSRIWYEGNPNFTKDPVANLAFLKQQQNYFSERLKARGVLFLNEVYEGLGFNMTAEGAQIGWIYDAKNPIGDNFVDFGIYDIHDNQKIAFVNGDERAVLLEFNHDGYILNKM